MNESYVKIKVLKKSFGLYIEVDLVSPSGIFLFVRDPETRFVLVEKIIVDSKLKHNYFYSTNIKKDYIVEVIPI